MSDLVKSLYETIPEFNKINDPFFDDLIILFMDVLVNIWVMLPNYTSMGK